MALSTVIIPYYDKETYKNKNLLKYFTSQGGAERYSTTIMSTEFVTVN